MASRFDPLIESAARWLNVLRPGARRDVAEAVADRLQAESLSELAALDVGLWGRPVYRSAVETAARLHAVAVTGDELG